MRYSVKGRTLRTENTAKPIGYASAAVLEWIGDLPTHYQVLDYGCGKLRHTAPLAARVRSVVAVDSPEQVERRQIVAGRLATLREHGASMGNVSVHSLKDCAWTRLRYDAALCTNVLSAIPTRLDRIKALRDVASVLKRRTGRALVTTQFRNSHYASYRSHPGAQWFAEGWLVESRGRTSFYALLGVRDVSSLCKVAGLDVLEARAVGETAFVVCGVMP